LGEDECAHIYTEAQMDSRWMQKQTGLLRWWDCLEDKRNSKDGLIKHNKVCEMIILPSLSVRATPRSYLRKTKRVSAFNSQRSAIVIEQRALD
jgi:hypothetical protein